jgi:hypothetical protein
MFERHNCGRIIWGTDQHNFVSETFAASIVGGVLEYATKIVPKIDDGMTLAERRDSWMEADQPAAARLRGAP